MPFGAGRHVCIGNSFALTEARLLVARLVQRYDARLQPGYELQKRMMITLGIEGGLPLEMIPRSAR
jgi:cytochrome P450